MKTIVVTKETPLEDALRGNGDEDVLVVRDGHPVALVIPFDEDDLEWYARERDPAFIASIAEARKQVEEGNTISQEDLEKKLGMR